MANSPPATTIVGRDDYFGNHADFFSVEGAHRVLTVSSCSIVEVSPSTVPSAMDTPPWESLRDACYFGDVSEFLFPSPLIPNISGLHDYACPSFPPDRNVLDCVMDLTRRIHADFTFDPAATTIATPLEKVMRNRRGVCQDFAQFQIGCLRSMGVAARYASGYLETVPAPGTPKLVGTDASHAWVQVFVPNLGWIDVDPTNNLLPSDRHIFVACGRDFDDVSPIRGVIVGAGRHKLVVAVDVIPLETG